MPGAHCTSPIALLGGAIRRQKSSTPPRYTASGTAPDVPINLDGDFASSQRPYCWRVRANQVADYVKPVLFPTDPDGYGTCSARGQQGRI